jgi:hypothetical protein
MENKMLEYKQRARVVALEKYGQSFLDKIERNGSLAILFNARIGETPEQYVDRLIDEYHRFLSMPEPDYDGADMDEQE